MTPCNYVHKGEEISAIEDLKEIDKNCNFDKESQIEYLSSSIESLLYFNTEIFNP